MNDSRRAWLIAAAATVAAGAGFALRRIGQRDSAEATAVLNLLALQLPDPDGRPQSMLQWQNKVQVINFWATWCAPCRDEIPGLLTVKKKYAAKSLQIVGIAIDNADKVKKYAVEYNMDYPLLIGGMETIDLTRRLGNRAGGLPFTVVLDQQGNLVRTHLGLITEAELVAVLAPLLG